MLVSLTLENFDRVVSPLRIDLRAAPTPSTDGSPSKPATLPLPSQLASVLFLLGKPGSARHSVQRAITCLRSLTLAAPRAPLPLRAASAQPTKLALEALCGTSLFQYELTLTPSLILHEALRVVSRAGTSPQVIYTRTGESTSRPPSVTLTHVPGSERARLLVAAQSTRPEQPFLHEALRRGASCVLPLGTWLRDHLQVLLPEPRTTGLAARASREPAFLAFLSQLVAGADVGIDQVTLSRAEVPASYFQSPDEQAEILQSLSRFPDSFAETPDGELIASGPQRTLERVWLTFLPALPKPPEPPPLTEPDLSHAARRVLHLAPLLYRPPVASTAPALPSPVALIDDLDRGLHPALAHALVRLLLTAHAHEPHAQLLCTLDAPDLLPHLALPSLPSIYLLDPSLPGGSAALPSGPALPQTPHKPLLDLLTPTLKSPL